MPQFKTWAISLHVTCKTSPRFTFNFKTNTGLHSRILNIIQLAIDFCFHTTHKSLELILYVAFNYKQVISS